MFIPDTMRQVYQPPTLTHSLESRVLEIVPPYLTSRYPDTLCSFLTTSVPQNPSSRPKQRTVSSFAAMETPHLSLLLLVLFRPTNPPVISTEAVHSLTVNSAAERPPYLPLHLRLLAMPLLLAPLTPSPPAALLSLIPPTVIPSKAAHASLEDHPHLRRKPL
jgi:hypothetical protein